mgnify:CR=1 FL=1
MGSTSYIPTWHHVYDSHHLDLPHGFDGHPIFHVSHLKEFIGSNDNIVIVKSSVTHLDLSSKPHLPNKNLDSRTKHLRSKWIREFKISWLDQTRSDATWEEEHVLKSKIPYVFVPTIRITSFPNILHLNY